MPSYTSPDLTKFTSYPQTVRRYLSIAPRNSLFNCLVNGEPPRDATSNGLFRFNYDNASGVSGLTVPGMTVDIGTSLGDRSIGSVRMRSALDATRVAIEEVSYGKVPIEDNHYASIIDEFLPAPKLPRLVGVKNNAGYVNSFTEYHDYADAYNAENTDIQPQANITISNASLRKPTPAGWVDDGQTYRTVTFSAQYSFTMKTSATISTRVWNMKDGTYTVGTSTSNNVTVRFPVGYRIISLTITDSAGTTHTQYMPIWVHDSSYPPITAFRVTSDNRDEGREMAFEVFGADSSADLDVIPKLATICYWEDAAFNGEDPPVEYIDSFLGWSKEESVTIKLHDRSSMTFTVGGIASWLSSFPGFGQKISHASTVNRWFKMQNITIDRMVHYILREYTTALSICNFYISGDTTTVRSEEIKKSDIWNQCVEMAKGNYSSFVADSLNGLWMRQHYSYLELDDRTDVDITMNLSAEHWTDARGLEIGEEYVDKISIVTGTGSYVNGNKNRQIYSKAPGLVPTHSGGTEEAPYQRLLPGGGVSQLKLNALTGHHYARVNNPRGTVTLNLVGNVDGFERAWGEPITLTWSEENIRGLVVNTEEFLITKVSVTHSNEREAAPKKIALTLEQATIGDPGETYTPPGSPPAPSINVPSINFPGINLPTYSPFEWYNTPPAAPKLTVVASQTTTSERMYRLDDTVNERIEWVEFLTACTGQGLRFVSNPFSTLYLGSGSTVSGWWMTTTNFSRVTDVFGTPSVTNDTSHPVTFSTWLNGEDTQIVASRITQNFVMALAYEDLGGGTNFQPYVCRTTDGVNWSYDTFLPSEASSVAGEWRLDMSPHIEGLVYLSGNGYLYESTDYGASWTDITTAGLASSGFTRILHLPYAANPNSRRFYFAVDGIVGIAIGPPAALIDAVTSGNTWYYYDLDNPGSAGLMPWPSVSIYQIAYLTSCDSDPTRMAMIGWHPFNKDDEWVGASTCHTSYLGGKLLTSRNAGKKFSIRQSISDARTIQIASSTPNFLYIFGQQATTLPTPDPDLPNPEEAYIAVSNNFGATIVEGTRNLVDFTSPQTRKIHHIFGSL